MGIRLFQKEDFESLLAIENECFKHPWKREDLEYEVSKNTVGKIFVYEDEGVIKGFLNIWITFDTSSIAQIAVLEEYRKQGIATALYKEVEKLLKNSDVEYATLEVRKSNEKAINFYKKMGFNEVVIKPHYYTDGEDAIYMIKEVAYGNDISD